MVENDKSIKCTKFRKIDQNVDYVSMWCGRRIVDVMFRIRNHLNFHQIHFLFTYTNAFTIFPQNCEYNIFEEFGNSKIFDKVLNYTKEFSKDATCHTIIGYHMCNCAHCI